MLLNTKKMKNLLPFLLIIMLSGCFTTTGTLTTPRNSPNPLASPYKGKFSKHIPVGEKELHTTFLSVLTKKENGVFINRIFYPELDQITSLRTYASENMKTLNGKSISWSDDGIKTSEGNYLNGKKEGIWKGFNKDGMLKEEINYISGKKEGKFTHFDETGKIINEGIYKNDEMLSETNPKPVIEKDFKFPLFANCDHLETNEERKGCADQKLLQYVYKNIKYPKEARENGVSGTALVEFYIEVDGSITDIKVIKGICKSIADEVERVSKNMPKWYKPGEEEGTEKRTRFVLPVKFRLA